ncbi:galectin-7-like isoform X2 [Rhineura floridana]|uniref:galectin-7-like isoform X2 n=1 Tax=Rhineura floridana TaxID=261503 RepID=UPI002AC82B81|nr:galectin-7-like isoform X2 [Rhineura floridana]
MAIEFETLVPYYRAIPRGLDLESSVTLEGVIPQQSRGFQVDFAYGQFLGASIPLRFKVSFEGLLSSPAIVTLNSFADSQWGKEVTVTGTPFRQNQWFKIQFIITRQGYKIMKEDTLLCDFDHRLSPKKIRFLEIEGDLQLKKVAFN